MSPQAHREPFGHPTSAPQPHGQPLEGPVGHVLHALSEGDIEVRGRIPWSSNATFLVVVRAPSRGAAEALAGDANRGLPAIYKPVSGERQLRDFPSGLAKREVAAYELSAYLGWDLVPPTIGRDNCPMGPGSLQYFVEALFDEHYFTLLRQPAYRRALRTMAVFDIVANNADRKAGHCLVDGNGHVWAIDNGLCFHVEPKLRTVIWDFAGERVPDDLLEDLGPLAEGSVPGTLESLLDDREIAALTERADAVRSRPYYPEPPDELAYPWPLI